MSSLNDFEVLSTLGAGSFSSVYKVKRVSDGQEYALKKVKLPNLKFKEKNNALNEVRILASIDDPSVIAYKHAFFDEPLQCLCIIMEYAPGGDLLNKITECKKKKEHIPEPLLWSYLIQMTQGLKALHDIKIIHRDLKSANVFLSADEKTVKLGDLNVSKITENSMGYTQAGTPYYASPEIWQHKPYGPKSDIWSLGCIMYELCTFLPPFRAANMTLLFQKVVKGSYEPLPSCYSQELAKIIGWCLNVQAGNRPTCDKILSHPNVMAKMTDEQAMNCNKGLKFNDLLGAIKMPRHLKNLNEVLPKANYKGYKEREVVSLVDLDASLRTEEDLMKRVNEQAPQTMINIEEPKVVSGVKQASKEDCIERILKLRDLKKPITPAPKSKYTLPATDPIKKTEKTTPVYKSGKAGMPNLSEPKKNSVKMPESLFSVYLPVLKNNSISRPASKAGKPAVKDVRNVKTEGENKENEKKMIYYGEDSQSVRPIY